jgi:hypothetical protein
MATPLSCQNPLTLISFLLVEFHNLRRLEDVYEKLDKTEFIDGSSDHNAVLEWAALGLSLADSPHLLRFRSGKCKGEMELIFSGDRLVQAGLQLFGDSSLQLYLQQLHGVVNAILGFSFRVDEVSPSHLMFTDNVVNGYSLTLSGLPGSSMAFRLADLKWCEAVYGPNVSLQATAGADYVHSSKSEKLDIPITQVVTCTSCGQLLRVRGRTVRCPTCRYEFAQLDDELKPKRRRDGVQTRETTPATVATVKTMVWSSLSGLRKRPRTHRRWCGFLLKQSLAESGANIQPFLPISIGLCFENSELLQGAWR